MSADSIRADWSPADVISRGSVSFFRQPADAPFEPGNILAISAPWNEPSELPSAFAQARATEEREAKRRSFCWNPEFGYVTARPKTLGTGLRISAILHLEGLSLIGDLKPTLGALRALRLTAQGFNGDGLENAGHVFRVENASMIGLDDRSLAIRVTRALSDAVTQELYARRRLVTELTRHFEDAVTRALVLFKYARLLSEWEWLDIVSPLRLAAQLDLLSGLTAKDARAMMEDRFNLSDGPLPKTYEEECARDRRDAATADKANRRFARVRFNARAEELFS